MYIYDFIWLPQIIDKLEIKLTFRKVKRKKCFSIILNIDSWSWVIT